jgi:hypothetical protein
VELEIRPEVLAGTCQMSYQKGNRLVLLPGLV